MNVSLEGKGLGHRFGSRVLFRRLPVAVQSGEVLGVTGANGSGKSTLLRILGGLLRPSAGSVALHIDGRTVQKEAHLLHVGFVATYANVYEDLSAIENLQFVARVRSLLDAEARIAETLQAVGLSERAEERVRTFSSGMQQRVKIAVAVLASPPVLLLDEPSLSLDASGLELCRVIVEQAQERGSVVVIASNAAEDLKSATRTICIEDYAAHHHAGPSASTRILEHR